MNQHEVKKKILVVDDDFAVRLLLERLLARGGYNVVVAKDGEVAQNMLKSESIDLVLVDLNMPVFDGFRLLRWIREDLQATIPVFIFTALKIDDIEARGKAAGANEVLIKNLNPQEVLKKIKEHLRT